MSNLFYALFHSWLQVEGNVSDNNEIDAWIAELNNNTKVDIHKIALKQSDFWFYDEDAGEIRNKNRSFFAIKGFQRKSGNTVVLEQPVILQNEIGYLGIM